MTTVRILAVALLVALITPLAQGAPAEGRLDVDGPLALPGGGTLAAPGGEMLWEREGLPALTISAASVEVERWGSTVVTTSAPLVPVDASKDDINERGSHESSDITLSAGDGVQLLMLRASVLDATLAPGVVQPVSTASLMRTSAAQGERCEPSQNCLQTAGTFLFQDSATDATFAGDVVMILRGPTVTVRDASGQTTYESGTTEQATGPTVTREDTWVVLRLAQASIRAADDTPLSVFAQRPTIQAPVADADVASGSVAVGLRRYVASAQPLHAEGLLTLVPLPLDAGSYSPTEAIVLAPGFSTTMRGDVQAISLNAVPLYEDKPGETAGALVGLAALAAAVAYFWPAIQFHGASLALPLYSRLSKPEILNNDVRNAIFEIIRQNPGISARAVHRMSAQSWGTVVYHLRQLERHHVVVSRALGRTRNYYENHGKYRGMEAQLACLQSNRARALARLISAKPGITQELLAEGSGFPQPTTSYYVRKLKQAGLVEEAREGRYARYLPHDDLARFLEMAETAPGAPPPDPAVTTAQA